ncbi:response regulator transcription factor [Desulfurivibrio alkaliphilus]|uniref:Two component transcriptional regulator, LuxR family n=1 Tax=Desulfurivibrio alkaliphilus (strain DSM 19089 / UNIQEM U267 / AHT2) TaxID=589865 RepID=D6Z2G7_DESAT|nr:response regulator transcription factor [Desulfurivibrio alkaliphilus]ADH85742.1 two component transcriptional regulator, LuxR family [Desulfurivibrio alkaliphilus AHT 2]
MKLAILEDDFSLRENLRLLLDGVPEFTVCGTYANGAAALAAAGTTPIDIMLVDLGLPDISGVEVIRKGKELQPATEFMAYTIYEDREKVFAALKAGASGYLLKGCSPRELIESIQELHLGGAPMSPKIARRLIMEFREKGSLQQNLLSTREVEIIREVEKGFSYKDIAAKLFISPHTVHSHIKKIYEKLHAMDRQDAILKARKCGLL